LALTILLAAGVPAGVAAAELVGHHALYRITLAGSDAVAGVESAEGAVLYRFADVCDGWTTENQTLLRLDHGEDVEEETVWTNTSWESKDGLRFRFSMRDVRDGDVAEELRGDAVLAGIGGKGNARFSAPDGTRIDLPPGTVFPTKHLIGLFEAARKGTRHATGPVFDGTSLDNPYTVSTVLGPASAAVRRALAAKTGLGDLAVWSVRMAFFASGDGSAVPKFEMGLNYREDGIADAIIQDFKDIKLLLTLEKIELLPRPDC